MIIHDGKGSGKSAGIDGDNRLITSAITASAEHYANHELGEAYNVLFAQSPTANDDMIVYLENTDDKDMVLEGLSLSVSAACEIYIQIGDSGTRNAATGITPVNLNSSSGKTATGNFEHGADLDGGAATITGGLEIERYIFNAATNTSNINFNQDIILTKSGSITIWCSSSAATATGTINFNYHGTEL